MIPDESNASNTDLTILIVTYNNEDHILEVLNQLLKSTAQIETQILIWDNASTDGTLEVLHGQEFTERCSILSSDENFGFARAMNELWRRADSELVLLLNPDCRVNRASLDQMMSVLMSSDFGSVGPVLLNEVGKRHAGGGWDPSLARLLAEVLYLPDLFPAFARCGIFARRKWAKSAAREYPVDWVAGTCLLTYKSLLQSTGGLSERWFMYCEDMEFGRNIREIGLKSALVASTSVDHIGSGSRATKSRISRLQIESLADYYRSNRGKLGFISALLFRVLLALFSLERKSVRIIRICAIGIQHQFTH